MLNKNSVKQPIVLVSVVTALAMLGDSLLYSLLPLYASSLGISTFMVGVLLSANRWVRLAANSLAARTFERWNFSVIMLVVSIVTAITTGIYAFPMGMAAFLAARILWGICYSHFRLGGYLVALKTSPNRLGTAMGVIQSVSYLGSVFAVLGGGLLADHVGYSWTFAIVALLSLGAVPFVFGLDQLVTPPVAAEDKRNLQPVMKERSNGTLSLAFCYGAGFITHLVAWGMVFSSLSAVLHERVGSEMQLLGWAIGIATISGFVNAINWVSTLVVSPIAGRLCDTYGRRGPFVVSTLLQAGSLALIAVMSNTLVVILFFTVFFIVTNAQKVFLDAAVGDGAQEKGSGPVGWYNSWQDLGAAAGPVLGYGLVSFVSFSEAYLGGAVLLLAIGLSTAGVTKQTRYRGRAQMG